ncbi:hypothetical protein HELRODRAFT_158686 [Helobdella robusta]|uniref:ubiquitinyl hydrolase 1 n=1 Tax=Helobdella robusta TaxID=6412 RepID=T1EN46_HELRO|nr:hypothetical protein HELRODRAFT_158686 [Helobdella robusta]ESO12217.1 hypothetical protein HELRODRAFT_158686 [Helobdella robusta]
MGTEPNEENRKGGRRKNKNNSTKNSSLNLYAQNNNSNSSCEFTNELFLFPSLFEQNDKYTSEFKDYTENEFFSRPLLELLIKCGEINWWLDVGCLPMYPIMTINDGNCLLHATFLGICGFHDINLSQRRRIQKSMMSGPLKETFFRKWKWHQMFVNKKENVVFSADSWKNEWKKLIMLASTLAIGTCDPVVEELKEECRRQDKLYRAKEDKYDLDPVIAQQPPIIYSELKEIHAYILANIIMRPIIVYCDKFKRSKSGEPISVNTFGGIYLPMEQKPSLCYRSPVFLIYHDAHFSALIPKEVDLSSVQANIFTGILPLMSKKHELYPIHFIHDPGKDFENSLEIPKQKYEDEDYSLEKKLTLLKDYLDIELATLVPVESETQLVNKAANSTANNNNVNVFGKFSDISNITSNSFPASSNNIKNFPLFEQLHNVNMNAKNVHNNNNNQQGEKTSKGLNKLIGKIPSPFKSSVKKQSLHEALHGEAGQKTTPSLTITQQKIHQEEELRLSLTKQQVQQQHETLPFNQPYGLPTTQTTVAFSLTMVNNLRKKSHLLVARVFYKKPFFTKKMLEEYLCSAKLRLSHIKAYKKTHSHQGATPAIETKGVFLKPHKK